jgi:hypothetical protein
MKDSCDKCSTDASSGSWHAEGNIYRFCKSCMQTLDELPTNSLHMFLGEKVHGQESKNIKRAKKMRELGQGVWSKFPS